MARRLVSLIYQDIYRYTYENRYLLTSVFSRRQITLSIKYDVINIKLDKCGGLTDALEIIKLAKIDGKGLMVGNMTGSSLSMAPSYAVGQFCDFIDLDGPLFLKEDVEHGLTYAYGGIVSTPHSDLWG